MRIGQKTAAGKWEFWPTGKGKCTTMPSFQCTLHPAVYVFFASKAGLIFQFPNDCDGDNFENAMQEVFRAFASFVSKVWRVFSPCDTKLCLTMFSTSAHLSLENLAEWPNTMWAHAPSSLAGLVKKVWLTPRSGPLLLRALLRRGRNKSMPLFCLGNYFLLKLYCSGLPATHTTAVQQPHLCQILYFVCPDPDTDPTAWLPGWGSDLSHHCRSAGWSVDCIWSSAMLLDLILTWTFCSASWLPVGKVPAHVCLVVVFWSQLTFPLKSSFFVASLRKVAN